MKKLFLFLLLITINIRPMDNMELDDDPQNTPPPVWEQIPWRTVPSNEFNLADRISGINRIIRTLSGVVDRLEMLPCNSNQKAVVSQKINSLKNDAIASREYIDHVLSTALGADDRSAKEETLKQWADGFLDPYHKTEKHLRASIENLERMAREQNHNGVNDLLEQLASLNLQPTENLTNH